MFYICENNELLSCGDYIYTEGLKELKNVTMNEYNNDRIKYIVVNNTLVLNPNYKKEEEQKEKERIANLTCTKRVFVLLLEELGLDYFEQIEPLINANRQARLEWELCERLERKNPLLDQIGAELKITPEQLDKLFKYANGEIENLV